MSLTLCAPRHEIANQLDIANEARAVQRRQIVLVGACARRGAVRQELVRLREPAAADRIDQLRAADARFPRPLRRQCRGVVRAHRVGGLGPAWRNPARRSP